MPSKKAELHLSTKEHAIFELRQICDGLFRDKGSIRMGIALHPMVERKREECLKLGVSTEEIKEIINSYRMKLATA
jgi:hypothetical protein